MNINKIFQKIADENGVSVSEVRNDMQTAINEGMKNPDPKVQAYWNSIPRKGERPSPEEVIAFVRRKIK